VPTRQRLLRNVTVVLLHVQSGHTTMFHKRTTKRHASNARQAHFMAIKAVSSYVLSVPKARTPKREILLVGNVVVVLSKIRPGNQNATSVHLIHFPISQKYPAFHVLIASAVTGRVKYAHFVLIIFT